MFKKILLTGVALLLLNGCNEANVQPSGGDPELVGSESAAVDPHSSEGRAELAAQLGGEPIEPIAVTQGDMSDSLQSQLDQLTGRLTLLQEQVIQIRSLTQQTLEQTQMNMTRLQSLSDSERQQGPSVAGAEEVESGYLETAVNDIDQAVAQLLSAMSMQSPQIAEASGPFRVATAFTRKGWILLRFHAQTGETWLADNNSWQPLRDNASLSPSSYEVQVQRADTDSKGYVAVRIDRRDGRSWWLNDDTWQVLN